MIPLLGNVSKIVRFSDLSIYFGNGVNSHSLALANMIFDNCKLYFYRNVTFTNTNTDNSRFIIDPTKAVSFVSSKINDQRSTKTISADINTEISGTTSANYTETLPTDPSL